MNLSRLDDVDEEDEDEVSTPEAEPVAVAITVRFFLCVREMKLFFCLIALCPFLPGNDRSDSPASINRPHGQSRKATKGKTNTRG